ncbi:hypothetical protein EDB81DRAFT_266388 [Dactylonectria macrodidyma]|uniref:Uncharacterized protein n=1 Tax=Dactylonectria macrodidyma TaxID=307937 RepID=A0A9P9JMS7_9HYPO|nr:hypothetical protein EDB81DRAFT_266388 [Dactylonectria macrodidyma]
MPCCIAILNFVQCNHNSLIKLGCTENCDGLCPSPNQQTLLVTRYLWSCEDCANRGWIADDEARSEAWTLRVDTLTDDPAPMPVDLRAQMVDTLHMRERFEDRRIEQERAQQQEEIQWVEEWTVEYGLMVWDILYERAFAAQAARRRVRQLRSLLLWDLVVTRDALRGGKQLRREQAARSAWIDAAGQQQSQYMQLPQSPNRNAAPPLFNAASVKVTPEAEEEKKKTDDAEAVEEKQRQEGAHDGEDQQLAETDESRDTIMSDHDTASESDFDPA